jgi:hypothetical protein
VAKAARQLRYGNEKLIEAKKLAEEVGNEEAVAKAMEKYEKQMEKVSRRLEKIKEKTKDHPRFQNLLDKFLDNGLKHHRIMAVLEDRLAQAPAEVREKIKAAHENAISQMGEVLSEVDKERLVERFDRVMEKVKGSHFKSLTNLEVLKILEEKLPEEAIPAIKLAQENALRRFKNQLEKLPVEEGKEKLARYLQKIRGHEARHLEILGELKERDDISGGLVDILDSAKERSLTRIKIKIENLKTEKERENYLGHLRKGQLKKLKILKEIENNLDPEDVEKLKTIKNKAMERFRARIEDPKKRGEILNKLKDADVTQFEVLEELGERMPEDKKEFIQKMRKRSFRNLEEKLGKIKDEKKKELFLRKILGNDPKQRVIRMQTEQIERKKQRQEHVCAQVITPARNIKTKECKIFRNSCLTEGWVRDASCEKPAPTKRELKPESTKRLQIIRIINQLFVEFKQHNGIKIKNSEQCSFSALYQF